MEIYLPSPASMTCCEGNKAHVVKTNRELFPKTAGRAAVTQGTQCRGVSQLAHRAGLPEMYRSFRPLAPDGSAGLPVRPKNRADSWYRVDEGGVSAVVRADHTLRIVDVLL